MERPDNVIISGCNFYDLLMCVLLAQSFVYLLMK
jgi:hypothetical protein